MKKNNANPSQETIPNRILAIQNRPISTKIWQFSKTLLLVIIVIAGVLEVRSNFEHKDNQITELAYCEVVKDKIVRLQADLIGQVRNSSHEDLATQQSFIDRDNKLRELSKEAEGICPSHEGKCLLMQDKILEESQAVNANRQNRVEGQEYARGEKARISLFFDLNRQFRKECGGKVFNDL
jgi:hypothetical protein